MPNKQQTGDSPLGNNGLNGAYLSTASSLTRIEQEIKKRTPQTGTDVGRWNLPNGIAILPKRARAVESCQLGAIRTDPVNKDKYMLSPGFVTGGGTSQLVEPDNLTPTIGDFVWLEIEWTADVIDEVLQAGGTMGAITVQKGTTIPDDTIPTAESTAGTAYIPLGGWVSDNSKTVWVKQGCGSIQVYFCPGQGFIFGRANEVQA